LVLIFSYMGAHYWIRWKNTVHDDVTKISRLVDCEPNEVRSLSILQSAEGMQEELIFQRVDQAQSGVPSVVAYAGAEWKYVKPMLGEADSTLIRRVASTLCEIYDPIALRESDMKPPEGEGRKALRIAVGLEGKKKAENLSVEFGQVGPDRMNIVMVTSASIGKRVVKIPDRFLQSASLTPEQYRSLQVMRTNADNIQQATLKIDGKERFSLERAGADWKILAGGKAGPASEEANRFVNRIATLKALDVLEPEHEPQRCRSGKAVFEVRGIAGREEIVRFDYGRGGDIAACSTSRSMKFRVHRDLLKYLDVPAESLTKK